MIFVQWPCWMCVCVLPRYQVWQPAWCSSRLWILSLASPRPYSPCTCRWCYVTGPRVWPTLARSPWPFVPVCEGACRPRTGGDRGTGDGRDTWFVWPCRPPLRLSYSAWSPCSPCWLVSPLCWVGPVGSVDPSMSYKYVVCDLWKKNAERLCQVAPVMSKEDVVMCLCYAL